MSLTFRTDCVAATRLLPVPAVLTAQSAPFALEVDATDVPRRLFHVGMTMSVSSCPLTLSSPKWIRGEHTPGGRR